MKFLADENIESELVSALRELSFDISDIKEISPGISDEDVLSLAKNMSAILITNDKDFGELVFRERLISQGIILLRLGSLHVTDKRERLLAVLNNYSRELIDAFVVISVNAVRIRKSK